MTIAVVVIVVIVVIGAGAFLFFGQHKPDDGVTSFRRHIDALSPEARREVIERVQNARESGKGK
ncbi:unannotated protein [freshwater metagenome]|uniref:Unannotated protein n=1 Tax=freshwater metagenome TaxID=449393 RepID=A0A6J7G1I0_9ZZZZ|nr:hypothetical protein [Actinomycetota bacterium]